MLFEGKYNHLKWQHFFAPTLCGQRTYRREERLLGEEIDFLKINKALAFTDLKLNTQWYSIGIYESICSVNVRVDISFTYNGLKGKRGIESRYHQLKLLKANGKWYIEEDLYYCEFEKIQEKKNFTRKPRLSKIRQTVVPKGIYKRQQAVAYAEKYAVTPNPRWKNYEKLGGDCTNFVSQCLYAGEIPFDNVGQYVTEKWYWYSDSSRTPSWTSANAFKTYMLTNKGYGLVASLSTLQQMTIGDVVQLGTLERTTHSMLVVDVIYSEDNSNEIVDLLVAQRSVEEGIHGYNIPLSSKPPERLYYKILGYNP